MIRSCKNCGGKLIFDISLNKLSCDCCGSSFDVSEYDTKEEEKYDSAPTVSDDETMECSIYTCNSCGAEISINSTESSTFCIYCGNPTVVFSRIARLHKPEMIIPFKVTKQEAMDKIKSRVKKGIFIPKDIKNFEIELMRGIYIPYYVTSVEYDGSFVTSSSVKNGKHSRTIYSLRSIYASLPWITTDASSKLSDSSSQRLEPYNMDDAKPFDEDYLIGFYSDMSDVSEKDATTLAKSRASDIMKEEVLNTVRGSSKKFVNKRETIGVYKKPVTAMLPAWFLTFRYKNTPYTIIVNGQTGKVVGGVPWKKVLFTALLTILIIAFSAVCVFVLSNMFSALLGSSHGHSRNDGSGRLFALVIVGAILSISSGINYIKKVLKSISRTSASTLNSFVSKRQKGE